MRPWEQFSQTNIQIKVEIFLKFTFANLFYGIIKG